MSRFGDKCNVTACNEPHDGIKHVFTGHKYCFFCAQKINHANRFDDMGLPFLQTDVNKGLSARDKRERQDDE